MLWFILALFIFVVVASLVDLSCNGWTMTKSFFTDSWAGIIAALLGLVSLLMFYGSSKSYRDVKINESFLPNPKRIKRHNSLIKYKKESTLKQEESLDHYEFDLSKMTMETLVQKMAFEMTKPGPVFFKGWGNHRLELDVERVRILGNYVEEIRKTGSSLMELHADAALSFEKIEKLTKIKRNELDERLIRSELTLDFIAEENKYKIEKMSLENAEQRARIRLLNAQAEDIEASSITKKLTAQGQYKLLIATSKKEKEIANILSKGAQYFTELPPVLKSYVVAQLGSDISTNPTTDMDLHENLKEFIIRKQNAEARKLEYEADDMSEQSKTQKAKLERERERYKKNGGV
ncbi:MAG: hypothetical protein EHM58_02565 [Ignavibacteriae bacterium]|nr:MAG: hypothetical protein EHM58_02565 [Ignavibacteriota bacterium]